MAILDMAALQDMSQVELEKMTKGELIAAIIGDQNKTTCTKATDGANGQVAREYVTKDALGVVLKVEQWNWSYKKTGEVSEIAHVVKDAVSAGAKVLLFEKIVHADGVAPVKVVLVNAAVAEAPIDKLLPAEEIVIK